VGAAKFRAAALGSGLVFGFASNAAYAKDPPLLSLTMEHFRDTATIKDDPQDAKATISTEKGFVEHSGPMRMVWHDEFLSAVIDKQTGQKSFQVHEEITYSGSWRFYGTANYQTANGPRSVPATQTGKEMANCAIGDCMYTERIAFPVEEELLRQLAAAYVPAKPVIWPYKVVAKSGPADAGGLSNAEIAGLLVKVDEYTATPSAVTANAAGASSQLDLGIGGLPVAATGEQPNRAGILVTAVTPGSVAHKSGIIVGDILFEFNGHPIKALAELRAAIAARNAHSAVPIKLYRGTDPMAVSAQF
jgi:hypothetical protein